MPFYSNGLISGPIDTGETVCPRASQFLEIVMAWAVGAPFVCELTNSELTCPPPLL